MLWSTLPPLLLAWTLCNVQFFSAVLVSLRCFPFTAYWESMPQILGRSNHALLRLLYWAPFSLVNSAYSITCFCAKERIFWHFPGEIHVELTNSVPSPYPPQKKNQTTKQTIPKCGGTLIQKLFVMEMMAFFPLPQYLSYLFREKLSGVNFSLFFTPHSS